MKVLLANPKLRQACFEGYSGEYRKYLWRVLRRYPSQLGNACRIGLFGHHLILFTNEGLLPRLSEQRRGLDREV
jgi:hypothetical protein